MKTWQIEQVVAASVLFTIAGFRGGIEWVGAAAVLLTFAHMTVSDRMAEKQAAQAEPDVHCFKWLGRYLAGKEILWLVYFVTLEAYTALFGVGLFLLYPVWRKWYRVRRPMGRLK